jgi:hypothetical protein
VTELVELLQVRVSDYVLLGGSAANEQCEHGPGRRVFGPDELSSLDHTIDIDVRIAHVPTLALTTSWAPHFGE